jgi:uncharacterized protein (TIGR02145 family)
MNCLYCKAEWTPPANVLITKCPFCSKPLFERLNSVKNAEPHEILLRIVQENDKNILKDDRLRGMLSDMMPHAESKYHSVFKKAIEDGVGAKLLELEGKEHSDRVIKISTLRDSFKTRNGLDSTAFYIVDCFLYALGWIETINKQQYTQGEVDNLNIIRQLIDLAFIDGILNMDEAKYLFLSGQKLGFSENEIGHMISSKIINLKFKPFPGIDKSLVNQKEIICSGHWYSEEKFIQANESVLDKKYKTVKIGTQVWMAENLYVDKFRNGDLISNIQSDEEWEIAVEERKPAWCFYNNDPANGKIYGKLYNWFAVNDPRGLTPNGWHVPDDAEWTTLTSFLGGEDVAGGRLKEIGLTHWKNPNAGATNKSGYTALPGGYRSNYGTYYEIEYKGYWWSSMEFATTSTTTYAWYRYISCDDTNVDRSYYNLPYGFSVRCIRDF